MSGLLSIDKVLCLKDAEFNFRSENVTSIVDSLEKKSNIPGFNLNRATYNDYLLQNIDVISYWFERNLYPSIYMYNNQMLQDCYARLKNLKRQITSMTKLVQMRQNVKKKQTKFKFNCNTCNYSFNKINDKHMADVITQHFESNMCEDTNAELPGANIEYEHEEDTYSDQYLDKVQESKTKRKKNNDLLYHPKVLSTLYPVEIVDTVTDIQNGNSLCTIQKSTDDMYSCLICKSWLIGEEKMFKHVESKYHKSMLANRKESGSCQNYHKTFTELPFMIQIHQVFFYPYQKKFECKLCTAVLKKNQLQEHINSAEYKDELLSFDVEHIHFYPQILNYAKQRPAAFKEQIRPPNGAKSGEKSLQLKENQASTTHQSYNDLPSTSIAQKSPFELAIDRQISNEVYDDFDSESVIIESEMDLEDLLEKLGNTHRAAKHQDNTQNGDDLDSEDSCEDCAKAAEPKVEHNIIRSFQANAVSVLDALENRFEDHKEFISNFDTKLYCKVCFAIITNNAEPLKMHLIGDTHQKNSRKKKVRYSFLCDLCGPTRTMYSEATWATHKSSPEHREKLHRQLGYKEYECTTCKVIFFGNNHSVVKHSEKPVGNQKKKAEYKLPDKLAKMLRSDALLSQEISLLSSESYKVHTSMHLVEKCCAAIENALSSVFPNCAAYPFGSRVSGLGDSASDLDIFIDSGNMYYGNHYQEASEQIDLVNITANTLKAHRTFMDIYTIPSARTPIVQVFHIETNLDCDLSFRHGLSVENTEYLQFCIDVQPKIKQLILFLKKWVNVDTSRNKISSFAIAMLAIFYMQVKNFLPSVKRIREIDPTPPKVIAGWDSFVFTKDKFDIYQHYSLCAWPIQKVLMDFFGFYAKFKFNSEVVCPLLGYAVKKKDFNGNGKKLPPEMNQYVNKINNSNTTEVFRSLTAMCVQDPFDLSHNLTKACPDTVLRRFVTMCQISYDILSQRS